jgi:hypothetical protein
MKLWNPTDKPIEFKYNQRIVILAADKAINVDNEMAYNCSRDFPHFGLVVLKTDEADERELKRREGYQNVYNWYFQQLRDWNSHQDDKRNNGQTIVGVYPRVKQLKKEIAGIEKRLGLERRLDEEWYEANGFNESTDSSEVRINHPKLPMNKRRGRPARVNIGTAQVESSV